MSRFVSWVLGIVFWVLGFVFWVLGLVFWVSGLDHGLKFYVIQGGCASSRLISEFSDCEKWAGYSCAVYGA